MRTIDQILIIHSKQIGTSNTYAFTSQFSNGVGHQPGHIFCWFDKNLTGVLHWSKYRKTNTSIIEIRTGTVYLQESVSQEVPDLLCIPALFWKDTNVSFFEVITDVYVFVVITKSLYYDQQSSKYLLSHNLPFLCLDQNSFLSNDQYSYIMEVIANIHLSLKLQLPFICVWS